MAEGILMSESESRVMTETDIYSVVKIHQEAFRGFFLAQMGTPFLKAYYRIVLAYSGSIAHVYVGRRSTIEGFAVGFIGPMAFYKKLKRSGLQLIVPILFGIILNPKLVVKVFENIKRVSDLDSERSHTFIDKDTVELSSIAVSSAANGLGSILLDAFVKDAWSRDISTITLTTDFENNELVNKFYIKNGFEKTGVETRKGRKLCRYILVNDQRSSRG
jgi:ribosomal protein S18 acetylase RimI-like enzyme